MGTVLIVAIVFGSIVALQWIKTMAKDREREYALGSNSVSLRELEERIEQVVQHAVAPLREQVSELQEQVDRLGSPRQLPSGRAATDATGDVMQEIPNEKSSGR